MEIVEFKNITKKFGNINANDNIKLAIKENSVHCIIGENGAGKSTLMKILFGVFKPDDGDIFIRGEKVNFKSSLDAIKLKIGMLYQHFMLIDNFTVLENVILGAERCKNYRIDFLSEKKKLNSIIKKYNLNLNIDEYICNLNISEKQKVELLKLLYRDSEIIILDEPTAVLTPIELKEFFNIINNFKQEGKTVILITHKLSEVKEVSDKVSVLRKGKLVYEVDKDNLDISILSRKIIGDIDEILYTSKVNDSKDSEEELLIVENVNLIENGIHKLKNLNFRLRKYNIMGICGVEGNGQNEIVEVLTGINKKYTGKILPEDRRVSLVPDDRIKKGMIEEMSISENYFIRQNINNYSSKKLFMNIERMMIKRFDIRVPYIGCRMKYLSGGNQQKAIVAREIILNNDILIFSHPTRGVDIKAMDNIHKEILDEANKGKAILLISSDLDELLSLSDELFIIFKGSFLKSFSKEELNRQIKSDKALFIEKIGELMMGILK